MLLTKSLKCPSRIRRQQQQSLRPDGQVNQEYLGALDRSQPTGGRDVLPNPYSVPVGCAARKSSIAVTRSSGWSSGMKVRLWVISSNRPCGNSSCQSSSMLAGEDLVVLGPQHQRRFVEVGEPARRPRMCISCRPLAACAAKSRLTPRVQAHRVGVGAHDVRRSSPR